MSQPQVVYSSGDPDVPGTLFSNVKFWIAQRVPTRSWYIEKVKINGGTIVPDEKRADIKIADHMRRNDCPSDSYSYTFIDACINEGALAEKDDHRCVKEPTAAVRPVGATNKPGKTGRTKYSLEDDKFLYKWVTDAERSGASLRGNQIYMDLEKANPRHPWQSWRDRWVKYVEHNPPKLAANQATPPTPPSDNNDDERVTDPPHADGGHTDYSQTIPLLHHQEDMRSATDVSREFTEEEERFLTGYAPSIQELRVSDYLDFWQNYAQLHPTHTVQEWREFYEGAIVPTLNASKVASPTSPEDTPISSKLQNILQAARKPPVHPEPAISTPVRAVAKSTPRPKWSTQTLIPQSSRSEPATRILPDSTSYTPFPSDPVSAPAKNAVVSGLKRKRFTAAEEHNLPPHLQDLLVDGDSIEEAAKRRRQMLVARSSNSNTGTGPNRSSAASYGSIGSTSPSLARRQPRHSLARSISPPDLIRAPSYPSQSLFVEEGEEEEMHGSGNGDKHRQVPEIHEGERVSLSEEPIKVFEVDDIADGENEKENEATKDSRRQLSSHKHKPQRSKDDALQAFVDEAVYFHLEPGQPANIHERSSLMDRDQQFIDQEEAADADDESEDAFEDAPQFAQTEATDTQALLRSETQVVDLTFPYPDGMDDIDDPDDFRRSLSPERPTSPTISSQLNVQEHQEPPLEATRPRRLKAEISDVDAFIEKHSMNHTELDIITALEHTTMDSELAAMVLHSFGKYGTGTLPTGIPGIWSSLDDAVLVGADARRMKKLENFHGTHRYWARIDALKAWGRL